jgi:DNA polymerase-3 subunit alpha
MLEVEGFKSAIQELGFDLGLKVGQYFDAEINPMGNVITLSYKGEDIVSVEAGEAKGAFGKRNKLKAVVKSLHEEDEEGNPIDLDLISFQVIRWADLHRHCGYSLLDGMSHIKDMVAKTEYAGALTDHGTMHGALEYYKQMKGAGKQPIIGFEAYVETHDGKKKGNHLWLVAKNQTGYKNLMKLSSKAQANFHRKPHVSFDMLREHSEGLITSTSCMSSEISRLLMEQDYQTAKKVAEMYIEIFGIENYYVEIQRHGIAEEKLLNMQLMRLAKQLGLKVMGTTDSHYTNEEDGEDHEILLCIGTGKKMTDYDRMTFDGTGYHIHTPEEIEDLFDDLPEALDTTLEIAEKCSDFEIELNKFHMPRFEVPVPFKDEMRYLKHLAWEGFEGRFKGTAKDNAEYRERLEFELSVIEGMGFPGYFLIVWDFVSYAKRNFHLVDSTVAKLWKSFIKEHGFDPSPILVGPGRGSVVGALTAFVLNITDLDPIPLGLLFERFLNPDRISMPDIDLDFPDDRREEVIDYVKDKYGEQSVAKIVTFGTLSARSVVRDVARVLDFPYSVGDKIAKSIPAVPKITLTKAFKESPEFAKLYENDAESKKIIDTAMKLEGLPRNRSIHACGVLIAPSAVSNYIPEVLMENDEGVKERTAQYNMAECEEAGILKMDFLGLRTMTVISRTLEGVNPTRIAEGKKPLHYLEIPLNDPKVYKEISKGESYGVFQLESPGMRSFMKDLFADADQTEEGSMELFERLVAGVSLYRPGPLDYIPDYLKNMRNPDYIQYDHPKLKPILEGTYGVIVYQEQCMFIVRELADFTKGEADNVRKAFAKKKEKMIAPLGVKFVNGCVKNGIEEELAQHIWGKMKKFGEYAFNKSHAGAYGSLSAVTAWLKYYHPVEFMTAVLNSYINKSDKLKIFLSVTKKMSIEILPPDVNRSGQMFTVDNGRIRFGLQGIKGLGKASQNIIVERQKGREFKNIQDLVERMAISAKIDKKIMEAMIYSGAVDSYEGTRNAKLYVLEEMLKYASDVKKEAKNVDQIDLFDFAEEVEIDMGMDLDELKRKVPTPDMLEMPKKIKLEKENEYAGFYVTEHPLDDYVEYFAREGVYELGFLNHEEEEEGEEEVEGLGQSFNYDGENVKIAGIIKEMKIFYTKKDNKPIYIFNVEDKTGELKAVCFADRIELNQDKLVEGKVVMIEGQIKLDDFGTQIIVRNMMDIEQLAKSEKPKAVWVKTNDPKIARGLFDYVAQNKGNLPVYVLYQGKKYKCNDDFNLTFATFSKLQDMFGQNVKVTYH